MVIISLSSSSSNYAYSKLRRQSSEVLEVTTSWCGRLQRSWKTAALFLILATIFVFIFSLYSSSLLARHRQNAQFFRRKQQQQQDDQLRLANLKSVLATDRKLRILASEITTTASGEDDDDHLPILHPEDFIHPNASFSEFNPRRPAFGPTMNTAKEIIKATEVVIDIKRPCQKAADNRIGETTGSDLLAVVFLFCVVGDFSRRQAIRETYGSALKASPRTELYFVLGQTSEEKDKRNDRLEAQLRNESLRHNDILQFAFTDAYYNLTLKAVATVRWTALHCSHARFAFKLDSDAYVRLQPFLAELATFSSAALYGQIRVGSPVLRDPLVKWAIDPRYWPYPAYPPYHAGPYLIPANLTAQLYATLADEPTTDTLPALPIDDVYITGVLAAKANISRTSFPGLKLLWGEEKRLLLREHDGKVVGGEEEKEEEKKVDLLRKCSVFFETLNDDDLRRLWAIFGDG